MAKVYAIQEASGKNLLAATNYGELEFLLPPNTNLMFSTESAVSKIRAGLEDFGEEDYLLLVGDPISIGIATHYAAQSSGVVKFLKWDNREYKYFPVSVDFK
jgi:hypothetical protein|tara:strand:- start:138 stop:443 length:306 start_codon:yes stop_codon:yes gene_type:complete